MTLSDTEAVRCKPMPAPVTVKVDVPNRAVLSVVTVIVDVPEPPATEAGLKMALIPLRSPLTLKVTVPVNPLAGLTVTV